MISFVITGAVGGAAGAGEGVDMVLDWMSEVDSLLLDVICRGRVWDSCLAEVVGGCIGILVNVVEGLLVYG